MCMNEERIGIVFFMCVNSKRGDGSFVNSSGFFNCNSFQRCILCARTHALSFGCRAKEGGFLGSSQFRSSCLCQKLLLVDEHSALSARTGDAG